MDRFRLAFNIDTNIKYDLKINIKKMEDPLLYKIKFLEIHDTQKIMIK